MITPLEMVNLFASLSGGFMVGWMLTWQQQRLSSKIADIKDQNSRLARKIGGGDERGKNEEDRPA